ncbi:MAG TPA: hypothetical protein VF678_10705, partial [bacterium]
IQSNAATAEETAAASQQLSAQAESLNAAMRDLTSLILGVRAGVQMARNAVMDASAANAGRATDNGGNGAIGKLLPPGAVRTGAGLRHKIEAEQKPVTPADIEKAAATMTFRDMK